MNYEKAFIPHGAYWSSPFCRWQGSLASLHSLTLLGQVAKKTLAEKNISPEALDGVILGITVPQRRSFYGAPWLAGMIGADGATGPTISQACATATRALVVAADGMECGLDHCVLVAACDRTSNGPHVYYPDPNGRGGMGEAEDPVWDNFNLDPNAGGAMLTTAENVARESGITREEQDAVALLRHEQYAASLANDRAFQKRYMVPIEIMRGKKVVGTVAADEGIHQTTREGLAALKPLVEGGSVTFGAQTHPADGNAGMIVTTHTRAKLMSRDHQITIQVVAYGESRVRKGLMPTAPVPAARMALSRAGLAMSDCSVVKTHNPFAVNDVYFHREMGVPLEKMNRYGSPLVYGHPQAPTALRAIIEMIEELVENGGGIGLFSGCAAGDTAMSLILRVS